ncbi:class I SAM-dependent methyltransferase [Acidothermaceae bacterium B102]|nr:class I SAM-dependent methyltransferase [Acidothermaceae bacterium B102]
MTPRALLFGSVASAYERYRLGYPEVLVDQVLAYAGHPVRTALEIGAGTGKATRAFAARGIVVTATDPDAEMLAELRRHVPDTVHAVRSSLESLRQSAAYDLVFAAASLHWTNPDRRWQRVAAMLTAGGTFASFGGQLQLQDPALDEAVEAARSLYLPEDDIPSPDGTPAEDPMQWPGSELVSSELFTDVRQSAIEQPVVLSGLDYVGYLSTVSAYLQLPGPTRTEALTKILDVLPDRLEIVSHLMLHVARRV